MLQEVWALNKKNPDAFAAVTSLLIDIGHDADAITIIEEAVVHQGENERVCQITGEIGVRLEMPHIAEKSFAKACQLNPKEPSHFLHLANAYDALEKQDQAIDLLKTSLEFFPDYAALWDAIGTLVCNYQRDFANGRLFLAEAIRLAPENAKYHHNLALTFGKHPAGEQHYKNALACDPQNPQIRLSYALYLLTNHRTDEAWPLYEARLDPSLGPKKVATYTHDLPCWQGEDLTGKSILVCAEQGIGDEVFFSVFLPGLIERAAHVYIGCDPRLVGLYERSFSGCSAFGFEDTQNFQKRLRQFPEFEQQIENQSVAVDYAVAIGSLPLLLKPYLNDFLQLNGAIFSADPPQVEKAAAFFRVATGRKKIAVSWRSGNLSGVRRFYYISVDLIEALARHINADFYVVQYSYSPAEKARLAELDNVYFFDGIDMKQDIEFNCAVLSQMDTSIGPPTATQMFAMASGCPICLVNNGAPWTVMQDQPSPPLFHKNSKLILLKQDDQFKTDDMLIKEISTYVDSL